MKMQTAYRIVEWRELYEVTDKSSPANTGTPAEKLQKGPLKYVRFRVYGRRQTEAYRNLLRKAWLHGTMMELAVFGLFGKLLELAADQAREFRGWILDRKQQPMTAKKIAETLSILDVNCVRKGLDLLADPEVGWIEIAKFPGQPRPARDSCEGSLETSVPDPSTGLFINETETETKQNLNESKDSSRGSPASVSDGRLAAVKTRTSEFLNQLLRPANQSDRTTLHDILNQMESRVREGIAQESIFDEIMAVAKVCGRKGRNPIAMFTVGMKQPKFGYMPEKKRVIAR